MKNNKDAGFFIQSETSTSLEDELKNKTIEEQKTTLKDLFLKNKKITNFSAFLTAGGTMFAAAIIDTKIADLYMGAGFGLGVFVAIVAAGIGMESYNNKKTIKNYFQNKFPEDNDYLNPNLEPIKEIIQHNPLNENLKATPKKMKI